MAELDDIGEDLCFQYSRLSGKIKGQTIYWVMEALAYEITGIFYCARLSAAGS